MLDAHRIAFSRALGKNMQARTRMIVSNRSGTKSLRPRSGDNVGKLVDDLTVMVSRIQSLHCR